MNMVPMSARQILEKTLDNLRDRANSQGEIFGGEILDCMRIAATTLGADRLELLLTKTVLSEPWNRSGETIPPTCCKIMTSDCRCRRHSNRCALQSNGPRAQNPKIRATTENPILVAEARRRIGLCLIKTSRVPFKRSVLLA
jgi:hypothetical protein